MASGDLERTHALYRYRGVGNGGPRLYIRRGGRFALIFAVERLSNLTCAQLAQESRAISKRGFVLSGLKAGLGGSDGTATAPATVIVWPATSSVGDKQRSENLALALKQMDAAEQASIESQCSIRFLRPLAG